MKIKTDIYTRTAYRVLMNLNGKLMGDTKLTMGIEGFMVSPIDPLVLPCIKNIYDTFKPIYVYDIDNYVTFTRLNTSDI